MATDKQVRYALLLLKDAGYSTKWMGSEFRALGAGMRERSGSVEGWLREKNVAEIATLIDELKELTTPAAKKTVSVELNAAEVQILTDLLTSAKDQAESASDKERQQALKDILSKVAAA